MKKLGIVILLLALLAACSQPEDVARVNDLETLGKKNKKIVEATADPVSECVALYSSPSAQATTTNAAVDPAIRYGSVGTLILSFNDESALAPAADFVTSTLGIAQGEGLGVFENLPMIALKTTLTSSLVDTLKSNLQGYGLLSIYQDQPLQYFLNESAAFIGAPAAREAFGVTGKGVGVAVLDSGVDGTQGDFANMVQNVKIIAPLVDVGVSGAFYAEVENSDLTSGHGTHVAGTIGGTGAMSNGKYTGIAPDAQLVGIGAGDAISILYALEGFDYAMDVDNREAYNIRIISNSWGSSGDFAPFNPISIASKRAYDLDMIVNFAAGNDGRSGADTMNPYSKSPCVIAVAAGDKDGYLADFSSRGVKGAKYNHPDITLPGVDIIAARATSGAVTPPFEGDLQYGAFYSQISGTSMATPHMSGVAALMLEANPSLNLDGVLKFISDTARPMYYVDGGNNGLNPDQVNVKQREAWEVGAGYADAYAAVQLAAESAGTRLTTKTETLETWNGNVGLAVAAPVAGAVVEAEDSHTVTVPAGTSALRVTTDWGNPALDLDLYVYDPSGNLIGSSAQGASVSEAVAIPNPVAGTYEVVLEGYLNTPTDYEGTAEIDTISN